MSQDAESNTNGNFPEILVTESSLTALGGANGDIEKFVKDNEQSLNDDLVRRHSLSLRTPPRNSIASDILQVPNESSLNKTSNLLNEVRNLASRLSEYETSDYSDAVSEAEGDIAQDTRDDEGEFQNMNDRKRHWRHKRKMSGLPTASSFRKKSNTNPTPPKATHH